MLRWTVKWKATQQKEFKSIVNINGYYIFGEGVMFKIVHRIYFKNIFESYIKKTTSCVISSPEYGTRKRPIVIKEHIIY